MRPSWLLFLCVGCAPRMRFPGPTGALGRHPTALEIEPAPEEVEVPWGPGDGGDVAKAAASFVGRDRLVVRGEKYRWDCSGFVCASYAKAGFEVAGSSRDLHALAKSNGTLHQRKIPRPGDVAFFDDTYDRNDNGRRDDPLSHVAIVESVDDQGTITLVHKGSKGVVRIHMNLKRPHDGTDESGSVLNDPLRAAKDKDHGATLTGELFVGFGSLWRIEGNDAVAEP